ncbi:signal recognition particle subunit SRP72-like [Haliotis asinina]|uniref:signal recognition particle subunit SRP72-like n=1 Tax=Haliotis asinina TaxID=109174 RepID=UPI0035322FB7
MAQQGQGGTLSALYADLNRFGQKQEYERAIKAANKILQQNPEEEEAFQCKVVSFILLDRFDEALTAIHKDKKLQLNLKFEKAYCEYRLNRTHEALTTLRSITNPDSRSKELLAQVLYRLEEYEECYDLYRDIVKNSQDDFDDERQTNLAAVVAALQMWDGVDVDDPGLEGSYEISYNSACYYIGRGDYKTAEEKLRSAEVALKNDPELAEDELEEELAIIRVQLAYVLQQLHRNTEANKLYNQVLRNKPSDIGLVAVASNNMVTLNKDQNVFDSKRKMKAATGDSLKHKLTSNQKTNIQLNQCLLHLYSNQGDLCHNLANKLMSQYPDIDTPVLIQAAQYVKDKDVKKAVACLQTYVKSHPDQCFSIQLVIAQLYLSQGAVYQACDALKTLGDITYRPGIVSALVTLYLSQEDKDAASEVLIKAVAWYKKNEPKSADLLTLTRAASNFELKNGNAEQAAKMLEDLRKSSPNDPRVLAQLISAYSQFNQAKAQQVSKDLPPVEEIAQSVDVDALEAAFSTLGPKYMKKTLKSEASPGGSGDALIKKKKRKKKKGKLPKNIDSAADLDPERWLPKRERSYYRGKRKDKRKDIGKGTQGATSGAAADMDMGKSPTGSAASSPRPGQPTSPSAGATGASGGADGPRQQKPAQANKKKRKKGNRW